MLFGSQSVPAKWTFTSLSVTHTHTHTHTYTRTHTSHHTPLREERQWRQWVDDRFVHTLSPNIYRTLRESMRAMDYISSVGNFSRFEQVAAKYAGAAAMFYLGRRLKNK